MLFEFRKKVSFDNSCLLCVRCSFFYNIFELNIITLLVITFQVSKIPNYNSFKIKYLLNFNKRQEE